MIEFTIVIESFTLTEGHASRFFRTLNAARRLAADRGEVVVADVFGAQDFQAVLARDYPDVRRLDVVDMKYDQAKAAAAKAARGDYVVFLDGDCEPQPHWLDHLLAELRREPTGGVAGFTRYDPGFYGSLMSVMDFGFLLPVRRRPVLCYASNNCGFPRQVLLDVPVPTGALRCLCHFHACTLLRRGTPVRLVPEARVVHETPAFWPERTRQGYDRVAAAMVDRALPEHAWLKAGILAATLFYLREVWLDWRRTLWGWRDLEMRWWQVPVALGLYPVLRLADLIGIARAFVAAPAEDGWGGTTFGGKAVHTPDVTERH